MRLSAVRLRVGVTVVLVAAMVALSACGGSSHHSSSGSGSASASSSGSASGTTSAAAAPPTKTATGAAFKIGFDCSCSGPQAAVVGDAEDVIKAWANYVNGSGGINGHPVDVIAKDDGQNPATALQNIKGFVQQDHVQAIIDGTTVDQVFQKYLETEGIPVVGGIAVTNPFATSPDWFPSVANVPALLIGTFQQARGQKRLGEMYCAETPSCAELVAPTVGIGKQVGFKTTAIKIAAASPNYTAPCLALKQAGAGALYIADNEAVIERVLAGCAQQGYKPLNIAQADVTNNSFLASSIANGIVVTSHSADPYDASLPAVKQFQDALQKSYPGLLSSNGFSYLGFLPWTGGKLFQAAAKVGKLTPSSTPAEVKAALYKLKGTTLGGLAPPLTYVKGKPFFSPCWFTGKIENKTIQASNGDKPTCLKPAQLGPYLKAIGG